MAEILRNRLHRRCRSLKVVLRREIKVKIKIKVKVAHAKSRRDVDLTSRADEGMR